MRYALPASYKPKTTENSEIEVWVRAGKSTRNAARCL